MKNMEAETVKTKHQSGVSNRLLSALLPALLISVGYVDPGKWVATIDAGAHFGNDLVALMLLFNLAAIFCQCLSAQIGIVTGRNLAQVNIFHSGDFVICMSPIFGCIYVC